MARLKNYKISDEKLIARVEAVRNHLANLGVYAYDSYEVAQLIQSIKENRFSGILSIQSYCKRIAGSLKNLFDKNSPNYTPLGPTWEARILELIQNLKARSRKR